MSLKTAINMFNKGSHFAIGFYVGVKLEQREWVTACLVTAVFTAYQVVEVWSKGDKGYGEIKEFGVGIAAGKATKKIIDNAAAVADATKLVGTHGDNTPPAIPQYDGPIYNALYGQMTAGDGANEN